jgi:predicted nucleotidyltransferase
MATMSANLRHVPVELRRSLEDLYDPRLVEVVLFGSQARNEAAPARNRISAAGT